MTRGSADRVFSRMVDVGHPDSDNRLQHINIVLFSSFSIDRFNKNILLLLGLKEPIMLRIMNEISKD